MAGTSKGDGAITKKQAEIARDRFLARLNAPTVEIAVQQVAATVVALLRVVAQMYEAGYLARKDSDRDPYPPKRNVLHPPVHRSSLGELRLNQIQPQAIEDWLHTTFDSWWTRHSQSAPASCGAAVVGRGSEAAESWLLF